MNPPEKAWARSSLASRLSLEVTTIVDERNCQAQAPSLIFPATLMPYVKMEIQVLAFSIIIGSPKCDSTETGEWQFFKYWTGQKMTANTWKTEYESLNNYIKDRSEILINKEEISIPRDVRDEFYQRFDDVRKAVVDHYYSTLPVDMETLSANYMQVEKEVIELLKLDSISMPVDLFSLLHNPKEGMVRVLYSRLFDLLQGKIALEDFEQGVRDDFQSASVDLYRLGYERWAALTLIKMLDPDEAYSVDLDLEYHPFLAELKTIAFGRQAHHPTIRLPEFVIHSRAVNKYLAVKMALARELEAYYVQFSPPVRPKKPTGDTSLAMDPRAMIFSIMSGPEDIPIIAELYDRKIKSPDLIVEFVTAGELENEAVVDQARRHYEILQPKLGICLLVMDAGGESGREIISDAVYAHEVGFAQSNLLSVTSRLA
jgi:hypothetical protein